ncbi:MAG: ATP-dependent RNA helicase [Desulfobacteraceae bacterium 4572_35.1]|nr:MAG: ATP-dependent RNA helicase [Desulfobacteraceae bacterium 4572_35.1]
MLSSEFSVLGVEENLLKALHDLNYQQPSPIQQQCIPLLLDGNNVLGTAQTGTGKTAAFALPLLAHIDATKKYPQMLVLAPTRELAIQVSEAINDFAKYLPSVKVLAVYGGQPMYQQLKALHGGVQVVVGTPGRIMDHMKRGSLKLDRIQAVVLDEADEMLRMGFIDDVETILGATPPKCQCALFSATMPPAIRRVAQKYLGDAQEVQIASRTSTVDQIEQHYLMMRSNQKFDVLCRILEADDYNGTIIFVRTKTATTEIAERLEARGHAVAALNGDLSQQLRERTIDRLKRGQLDTIVATDVAARGLDVERISHVFNYDIPYDTEAYIHRIGRTGRAGRTGKAILFVCPPERRLLKTIERATKRQIPLMQVPTSEQIGARRVEKFTRKLLATIANQPLQPLRELIQELARQEGIDITDIAAALAFQLQENNSLFPNMPNLQLPSTEDRKQRGGNAERNKRPLNSQAMQRYRIAVGRRHNITPRDIVGAFTNEGRINIRTIGRISLYTEHATIELAQSLSEKEVKQLQGIKLRQQDIKLQQITDTPSTREKKPPKGKRVVPRSKKAYIPKKHC